MNTTAAHGAELDIPEKKELSRDDEQTRQGRIFAPLADIYETQEGLVLTLEIPGVDKQNVDIKLDKGQLTIHARISVEPYDNMQPLYTEYNIGDFARSFSLPDEIDQEKIQASVVDGVLTLNLPKVKEAAARTISVS